MNANIITRFYDDRPDDCAAMLRATMEDPTLSAESRDQARLLLLYLTDADFRERLIDYTAERIGVGAS